MQQLRSRAQQLWPPPRSQVYVTPKRSMGTLTSRCANINWRLVAPVSLFAILLLYHTVLKTPTEISIPRHVNLEDYMPFEPNVIHDFDISGSDKPKIQRIIHQTWKDTNIPPQFVDNIKSFIHNNPSWEYYLWTDDSARELIKDHYPWFLPVWDGYYYSHQKIRRADALRYFVLYHYGGVYADMDAVNYRPLDAAITKHGCVFMPEPYPMSAFRAWVPYLINNAVMMCRARHPFLKQLMENLYTFEHMQAVWDSTGPGYVTTQYQIYNNLPKEKATFTLYHNRSLDDKADNSPYLNKGSLPMEDEASVYIANTQYFIFSIDENGYWPLYRWCKGFDHLTHLQKRACVDLQRHGLVRKPNKYAFIDHKWYRTYGWWNFYNYMSSYSSVTSTPIVQIAPNYKIYKSKQH